MKQSLSLRAGCYKVSGEWLRVMELAVHKFLLGFTWIRLDWLGFGRIGVIVCITGARWIL